jgi:hypothetical protein
VEGTRSWTVPDGSFVYNGPSSWQTANWLGRVGALSGLTRLSALSLRDRSPYRSKSVLGLSAPEALLADLPSWPSLSLVGALRGDHSPACWLGHALWWSRPPALHH